MAMRRVLRALGAAALLAVVTTVVTLGNAAGCSPGVGERCNPMLFTPNCPGGTMCIYPTNCAVAFCCPAQLSSDTSANCSALPGPRRR